MVYGSPWWSAYQDVGKLQYSKTANKRTPGATNEYTGGLGAGFCGPGGGFSGNGEVASQYCYEE